MIRLHSHSSVPPGEYVIRIIYTESGYQTFDQPCGGTHKCQQFGPSPLIDQVAKEMIAFLKANKIPSGSFGDIVELIDSYTCTRLGNHRDWCFDSERRVRDSSPTVFAASGGCAGCGVKL